VLDNEEVLLEFTTKRDKKLTIAKDKSDTYLVYRYGTADKIEFEFPTNKRLAYQEFSFSWYYRGGGVQNEGMDLNYLYFKNGNYKYVVYQEYIAQTGKIESGILVINMKTDKRTTIKAVEATVKGSLYELRDDKKINVGEELFR